MQKLLRKFGGSLTYDLIQSFVASNPTAQSEPEANHFKSEQGARRRGAFQA